MSEEEWAEFSAITGPLLKEALEAKRRQGPGRHSTCQHQPLGDGMSEVRRKTAPAVVFSLAPATPESSSLSMGKVPSSPATTLPRANGLSLDTAIAGDESQVQPAQQNAGSFEELLASIASLVQLQVQLAQRTIALHPHPEERRRHGANQVLARLGVTAKELTSEAASTPSGPQPNQVSALAVDGEISQATGQESWAAPEKQLQFSTMASPVERRSSVLSGSKRVAAPRADNREKRHSSAPCSAPGERRGDADGFEKQNDPVKRMIADSTWSDMGTRAARIDRISANPNFVLSNFIGWTPDDDTGMAVNAQDLNTQIQILPRFMFHPDWTGRYMWDFFVVMLVILDSMFLPYQLAYKVADMQDKADQAWFWTLTLFFSADICINFFTAFVITEGVEIGKLVTDRGAIARHYLRAGFPIDFISTVPWFYIAELLNSQECELVELTQVVKFVRFFRIIRLLRLTKIAAIWDRFEESMGSMQVLQVVSLIRAMMMIFCICHWNACLWFIVGKPENLITDMFLTGESKEWYQDIPHWTTQDRFKGSAEGTWRWIDRPPRDVYIFCFYWTLGVMRTMPQEVTPVNHVEWAYVMAFMFLAFSVFAIGVSTITSTFFKIYERRRVFNEDMAAVRCYLKSIDAPLALQESIKSFMHLLFDRRRIQANEAKLFDSLPAPLAQKLRCCKVAFHMRQLEILRGLPYVTLLMVSTLAEVVDMVPGERLCERGDPAEAAWVLISGSLQELPYSRSNQTIQIVDEECLRYSDAEPQSSRTITARVCSEVVKIYRRDFLALAKQHAPLRDRLLTVQDEGDCFGEIAIEADTPLLS